MVAFRLQLLGRPAIFAMDGELIAGLPKKAFMIAALCCRSVRMRRAKSELAEFLWPSLASAQRANNLRQLLFRVRQFETRHYAVLFEGNEEEIGLSAEVDCDLLSFEETVAVEGAGTDRLLSAYTGPLLEGFSGTGHSIRQWLSNQRLQLEEHFVDLLLSATDGLTPEQRRAELTRGIKLAPNSMGLRKALMRQLVADGSTHEARRQYREIQNIGGHGVVAAPPELVATAQAVPASQTLLLGVPLAQVGRDQARVPHLVLLPPKGIAANGDGLAVAEALVDDVTIALTQLRSVSVLAPYTARRIVDGDDAKGVGLARADFVLRTKLSPEGVRHRGGVPRLSLALERAASGDIVWAEGLSLDPDSGPTQFAAVANGVALTLVDQIERATLRSFQVPADAGAYGHYLLGQKALQILDLPSIRRARSSFKSALASSPNFAPAHTGFAQSLVYEWVTRGQGDMDLIARAGQAAERAREIDPLFGGAHQMLGRATLFSGDFAASLSHFERAETLNPHHADLLCDLADTLMHASLAERANDKIELALRLNPLAPDAYWWASAGIKFFIGEYEGALGHLSRVKNSEPVLRLTAACAAMAGQQELAKLARNRFLAIDPGFKLDEWISVLPMRDPSHRRQYRQALQKAGFK
jgi:DNA-binding SARP family transcriptional activator/tetratricopeptide (TPR) repeat protein